MEMKVKVFGAALDASDFPLSIQMKRGYLNRLAQNLVEVSDFLDPYEAFLIFSNLLIKEKFLKIGKFPINSWLTPKPDLKDLYLIDQSSFERFTSEGNLKTTSERIEEFIKDNIIPDIPLMIGVDHSLTGGVLKALSEEFGSENLIIIIFDAHFDGLPANISVNIAKYASEHPDELNPLLLEESYSLSEEVNIKDNYTCASFLNYLIEDNIIRPENLIIFGCQDYPDETFRNKIDPRIKEYIDFYDKIEKKGVKFIPKTVNSQMLKMLNQTLQNVSNSNFYVSIDVDVGALKKIIATRFRNAIGLEQSTILDAATIINNNIKARNNKLIGLDVMEIETHLLNKDFPKSGRKDQTIEVVDNFLEIFFKNEL
jgi:arginase family enzyme